MLRNLVPVAGLLVAQALTTSAFLSAKPWHLPTQHLTAPRQPVALRMSVPNPLDTLTSGLASIVRMPGGVTVSSSQEGGPTLKVLYDIENDAACRRVRERITEYDLVVSTVVPSAPNSRVFTSGYKYALPQGTEIPRLVIANEEGQEVTLSGEEEILAFLDDEFAANKASETSESPLPPEVVEIWLKIGNVLATILRTGRGSQVSPAAKLGDLPSKQLVLYSYEGNQFCRLVREVLTELDLPYELRSAGKESPRRAELAQITGGSSQCPYLLDPNQDVAMAESADIIAYLYKNYARWTPPNEALQWTSENVMKLAKPIFEKLTPLQAGSGGEDGSEYQQALASAKAEINRVTSEYPVVVYTYSLSPFSSETKTLLERLNVDYHEVSLGAEWIPGLLKDPAARAALLEMTGQSSLPHVFVGGQSIGGLFSGNPGLVPLLEEGKFADMIKSAEKKSVSETV